MFTRGRPRLGVPTAVAGLLAFVILGFILFAARATRPAREPADAADAIVVLTGEASRIQAGASLLSAGRGTRLLITGVNRKTSAEELRRVTGLGKVLFRCCVDIGYEAQDTIGNAEETRAWTATKGYRSLIVVTAAYHMPRARAEFSHALQGVALIPFSVPGRHLGDGNPWWLNASASRILAEEYLKVLVAAPRLAFRRLVQPERLARAPDITSGWHVR